MGKSRWSVRRYGLAEAGRRATAGDATDCSGALIPLVVLVICSFIRSKSPALWRSSGGMAESEPTRDVRSSRLVGSRDVGILNHGWTGGRSQMLEIRCKPDFLHRIYEIFRS